MEVLWSSHILLKTKFMLTLTYAQCLSMTTASPDLYANYCNFLCFFISKQSWYYFSKLAINKFFIIICSMLMIKINLIIFHTV